MTLLHSKILIDAVVRATTSHEMEQLERFRYEVYVEEQKKLVPGADTAQRRLRLDSDQGAVHYYLRDHDHGGILGYVRGHFGHVPEYLHGPLQLARFENFCSRQDLYFASQLMVSPKARNLAVMRALTSAQFRHLREHGLRAMLFHCRTALAPIYVRSGAYRYAADFDLPGLGTHAPIVAISEAIARFAKTNSYFYPICQEFENRDDFRLAFLREFADFIPKE